MEFQVHYIIQGRFGVGWVEAFLDDYTTLEYTTLEEAQRERAGITGYDETRIVKVVTSYEVVE